MRTAVVQMAEETDGQANCPLWRPKRSKSVQQKTFEEQRMMADGGGYGSSIGSTVASVASAGGSFIGSLLGNTFGSGGPHGGGQAAQSGEIARSKKQAGK